MTEKTASEALDGWNIAHAAARMSGAFDATVAGAFTVGGDGQLCPLPANDPRVLLHWNPSNGWSTSLPADDSRRDLLELYLPISSATAARPITIGHLGQSLDGFIATPSGDSCFVTGPQNILHLHRLRALSDAVIVGACTAESDNPRLTTRLVAGRNPLRVVLDPRFRLSSTLRVFSDGEARTVRACAVGSAGAGPARDRGEDILEVEVRDGSLDLKDLLNKLRERGCSRIFVEGGGVTVSSFLEAGLLDRLHLAVAPLLIGDGRSAIRLAPRTRLQDCMKLNQRVYRSGNDILFDCDLRSSRAARTDSESAASSKLFERIL
jgi:diaminohydroxyphosphoribosylaminopyrimidine deaminase / 5-amino-6-(5-phosphoribosylamino)uracil reductase